MSINLETETIKLGKEHKILRWEVWFQTPSGLCEKLQEAKDYCLANDFDVKLCVWPVAVAVSEENYEVSIR